MKKYGTTEKDMPFYHQKKLMQKAGFGVVEQYIRLSQLPVENIATLNGSLRQVRHGVTLGYGSATGLTSVVVARKTGSTLNSTFVRLHGHYFPNASFGHGLPESRLHGWISAYHPWHWIPAPGEYDAPAYNLIK